MSEPAQPLSRRERREMEEAARLAEGDETQALPIAPETESIVSRRERRRMERLAHPVETWTAEEEMIATGQMPAMTSEVLAEQERLARERAEQAHAFEAAAAAAAYAETAPQPAPDAVVPAAPEAAPEAVVESAPEAKPAPESNSHIPADLRHLFPPGSLQARALESQHTTTTSEPVSSSAADEIRRLSHEAMAGLSRAVTDSTPVVPGTEFEPVEFVAPAAANAADVEVSVPELPDGVDVEALWNAPTVDEPVRTPAFPDAGGDQEPQDLSDAPAVADVPSVTEPHQGDPAGAAPVWSALVPTSPAPRPAVEAAAQPAPQPAPQPALRTAVQPAVAPVVQPVAEAAPSAWDTHPLTHPGGTPVRELPAQPVTQNLPRPDLTALLATQAGPGVGQVPATSTEATTATGAVLRPLPEPQAGGGARHFRWVHLAVIGAIAFVLGVLAWNIARSSS